MVRRSEKAGSSPPWLREQAPLPESFGLLSPLVAQMIAELRVGVSLWHPPIDWNVIHEERTVTAFETEHGQEQLRWPYNERCFAEVLRTGVLVRGVHAGFRDLFVPVLDARGVCAVLVVGPYSNVRATSQDIVERWAALTRSQPMLSDAGFRQYVSATLSTLTLEGPLEPAFERMVSCLADLGGGHGSPRALVAEAKMLRTTLAPTRSAERTWEIVRSMVSERAAQSWAAPDQAQTLWHAGLRRVPGLVAVALFVGRPGEAETLDGLLCRDAYQRAATMLARKTEGFACGRVGDHGVVFLSDDTDVAARARARLWDLVVEAQSLARRFGLTLHVGMAQPKDAELLPRRYLVALAAAEKALSDGVPVIHGQQRPEHSARHVRRLRQRLSEGLGQGRTLSARFEHYIETVLVHCEYSLEPVRAKLDAGLERLSEPLVASGSLDERSFDELAASLERSALEDPTVNALVARYRQVVSDMEAAMSRPTAARHERSVQRALAFMRDHVGEPLSLGSVARIAGFAPDHFSKLFKRAEKTSFEHYLLGLRLERAKQLLRGTTLTVQGISGLCGFKNRIHFHRAFRTAEGITPAEYRRGHRGR